MCLPGQPINYQQAWTPQERLSESAPGLPGAWQTLQWTRPHDDAPPTATLEFHITKARNLASQRQGGITTPARRGLPDARICMVARKPKSTEPRAIIGKGASRVRRLCCHATYSYVRGRHGSHARPAAMQGLRGFRAPADGKSNSFTRASCTGTAEMTRSGGVRACATVPPLQLASSLASRT